MDHNTLNATLASMLRSQQLIVERTVTEERNAVEMAFMTRDLVVSATTFLSMALTALITTSIISHEKMIAEAKRKGEETDGLQDPSVIAHEIMSSNKADLENMVRDLVAETMRANGDRPNPFDVNAATREAILKSIDKPSGGPLTGEEM